MRFTTEAQHWPLRGPDHGLGFDLNHSRGNEHRSWSVSLYVDLWLVSVTFTLKGAPTAREYWWDEAQRFAATGKLDPLPGPLFIQSGPGFGKTAIGEVAVQAAQDGITVRGKIDADIAQRIKKGLI